jgi:probable HAF family extracellular repeat protein
LAGGWRAPLLLALTAVTVGCEGASEDGLVGPNMAVGAATRVVFTVEPVTTTAKSPIFPAVRVTAVDPSGNTVTAFKGKITLAIGTNPSGGLLFGARAKNAVNGVAVFSDLSIDKVGTGYTLTATASKLIGATSAAFNIAHPATRLVFSAPPTSTTSGTTISPAVQVTALDRFGKLAEGYRQNITVALGTNPGGGTLSGTTTVVAVFGVATFSDLSIDEAGTGYTLRTTSLKLPAVTSAPFDISGTPAPTVVNLGTLGGTLSEARGINDNGQVVGYSYISGNSTTHAFLWQNGTMTDLGTLGGSSSLAQGINNSGRVAGQSSVTGDAETHAVTWQNGTITDLGTPGQFSGANAINDNGQVVGAAYNGSYHATLWQNGTATDLGTLSGTQAAQSFAVAINASGQVVGYSSALGDTETHAFLWQNGTMSDLGTLGGTFSQAFGINTSGQVVGISSTAGDTENHAFLWQNGTMTDLGTLGGTSSHALGINANGQVAGHSPLAGDTQTHAFLWENGTMSDLGTLGGTFSQAEAINADGQVVGWSTLAGSTANAYATLWSGF